MTDLTPREQQQLDYFIGKLEELLDVSVPEAMRRAGVTESQMTWWYKTGESPEKVAQKLQAS